MVSKIEKALENNEICVILFLDISAAFNNVSVPYVLNLMKQKGMDHGLIRWMKYLLENRITTATLQGTIVKRRCETGTPQGGVNSAGIIWNLV